jgi:alginate O-acetyltransferase complex protein AlgI
MSFVDIRFLVFLPVVWILHFLLPKRLRWVLLLIASYIFYMAWKPIYGLLLFCITALDYVAALGIARSTTQHERRAWLGLSLAGNLGILFTFKYFNFLVGSFVTALHALGTGIDAPLLSLLLPIGISFHVFQSISYTIDVYLGRAEATRHFGKFALYVSFFPQLVAGPIERPGGLLAQILAEPSFRLDRARSGALLILWGFFKKLVIADNIAPAVAAVFSAPDTFTGPSIMIAAALFSYQIYCDFSGYTDIARGVAKLFGYDLMLNFNRPYASQSISEFWRRWHISLSAWFREYVYIPLGGNRGGTILKYRNLAVTFLLSGLWHGAAWTFVVWGGLNALYMIVSDATIVVRGVVTSFIFRGPFTRMLGVWRTICTFSIVTVTWIFFRAANFHTAWYMITHLGSGFGTFATSVTTLSGIQANVLMGTSISALECVPVGIMGIVALESVDYLRAHGIFHGFAQRVPRPVRLGFYGLAAFSILIFGQFSTAIPFIYFQF